MTNLSEDPCPSCRAGDHQHDRHTGLVPGAREGDDAGCPYLNLRGKECGCAVVLAAPTKGRRHCETCRCANTEPSAEGAME